MTNAAAELLASKPNVLLDFDGPVCSVFGGVGAYNVARQLRERLGLNEQRSVEVRDPFEILRYAAAEGQREAVEAERELTKLEVDAVASAPPTAGATELLRLLADRGQRVVIVSNNSAAAVRAYLNEHRLTSLVHRIVARTRADPAILKPAPYFVCHAIHRLGTTPDRCVMIGDSATDIDAAKAAQVAVIAYANKKQKIQALYDREPDALIHRIVDLYPPKSPA